MVIVQEHTSEKYSPRTYFNAKSGDVTLALAVNLETAGEKLTHKAAGDKYIGFLLTDDTETITVARELYKFMKAKNAKTLNIAGNGIYTLSSHNCSQEHINNFVCDVIEKVHQYWPIEKIYTGGQTGVDLSGAVVAKYLGIDALITLPKGYIQRFENKIDITQSKEDVENQIEKWVNLLKNQDKKINKVKI
ncbi:hypothetical protein GW796_00900 [archaeon]|nr:hypothetical protein [archaeon]NCQ50464.1 hypothetical protein [archaeon]